MGRSPWLKALVILGVLIAAIYLFTLIWEIGARFADTILVFLMAYVIAFLLNPFVDRLIRWRRMPRLLAVSLVILGLAGVLALLGLLVVPPTVQQATDLGNEIPDWGDRFSSTVDDIQGWLDDRGIEVNLREYYQDEEVQSRLKEIGSGLADRAVGLAQQVLVVLLYVTVTLIVAFYLLLDGPRMRRAAMRVTPPKWRPDIDYMLDQVDSSFGAYIRSWAILAVIYGGGTAIIMFFTHIPFILPVAVFAGFMLIIPFIGDIVAVIPPIVIGLLSTSVGNVVIALIALVALQQLVLQILRPKIMGESVGLHPVLVLGAFLVGASAAGIWGAFFSVPVAGVVQSVISLFYHRYVTVDEEEPTAPATAGSRAAVPGEREDLEPALPRRTD